MMILILIDASIRNNKNFQICLGGQNVFSVAFARTPGPYLLSRRQDPTVEGLLAAEN